MIKTDIDLPLEYTPADVREQLCRALPLPPEELTEYTVRKKELRRAPTGFFYRLTVALPLSPEREAGLLKRRKAVFPAENLDYTPPPTRLRERPVVVGSGPCGLLAALALAEAGARPILLERGEDVTTRARDVARFYRDGTLSPESNIAFGEGGAGTFSDGKLKVGGMTPYKYKVLSEFVRAGAPADILYTVGAHLGTDRLQKIVAALRARLLSLGGEVYFGARFTDFHMRAGRVCAAVFERRGERCVLPTSAILLATGHSARDTYEMLLSKGVPMEPRGFGVGVRVEHPREYVDRLVYRGDTVPALGAASYHLVTHLPTGRSVYSFCMCPGGEVVAAASEPGGLVTNGMSAAARSGRNSNAALLVSVTPADFPDSGPLGGVRFQRRLEQLAFTAGGGAFAAPALSLGAFLSGGVPRLSDEVAPTYPRGVRPVSPDVYLPAFVTDSLRAAFPDFDDWMPGYSYAPALLTGTETRSTAPVRILRQNSYTPPGFPGLYPAGEGAGYAGGIVSSAADGIRVAEAILRADPAL